MIIPKQLPQFTDEKALLIAASPMSARFFVASNGVVNEVASFVVPRVKYSDAEGFSQSKRGGKTVRSGSVREKDKVSEWREFSVTFRATFRDIAAQHRDVTVAHVFAPPAIVEPLRALLPAPLRRFGMLLKRNLVGAHPRELIEAYQSRVGKTNEKKRVRPEKEEAVRILRRTSRM